MYLYITLKQLWWQARLPTTSMYAIGLPLALQYLIVLENNAFFWGDGAVIGATIRTHHKIQCFLYAAKFFKHLINLPLEDLQQFTKTDPEQAYNIFFL